MKTIVAAILVIGAFGEVRTQRTSTPSDNRIASADVSLHSRTVRIAGSTVSCETLVVTSVATKKAWPTNGSWGPEQSLSAEINRRSDKVAMNIGGGLLRVNTADNVGIGRAEPSSYRIVKETSDYVVAATSAYEPTPTAITPAFESIVLNKRNGLAIWTITGHEIIPGQPPDTYAIYLQCR